MKQNVKLIKKNRTKCNTAEVLIRSSASFVQQREEKNTPWKWKSLWKLSTGKMCVCFEFVQLPKIVLDYVLMVSKRYESFFIPRIYIIHILVYIRCIIHACITKDFIAGLVTSGACNIWSWLFFGLVLSGEKNQETTKWRKRINHCTEAELNEAFGGILPFSSWQTQKR